MVAHLKEVVPHDHLCLVYESHEEQVAAFVPFIRAGLVQNDKCIYLTDDSDASWVISRLGANDFPIDEYLKSGAFSIIGTRDAYLKDGLFDLEAIMSFWDGQIKAAVEAGYRCVRATGEMTWALRDFPGCDRLLEYESRVNSVLPSAKLIGLCQYDRKRFDPAFIQRVIHTHPFVCVSNQLVNNPAFISPEKYSDTDKQIELQAFVDNLLMSKQLAETNRQLQQALKESQRAQLIIAERQKESEELYQELVSLARVLSHELQAPLSITQSYLRLLSARYKDKLGADADEFIDKTVDASRLIARMIDDLWTYARVDSSAESVVETVDPMRVLTEVLDDTSTIIKQTSAKIEHNVRFPSVRVARRHLVYLLKALIGNAMKYRNTGVAPLIYVGVSEDERSWKFSVKDNGIGIDKIHGQDIFKLFHRINGSPSEDGTGMGLSICKRIIDHYHGKIWFESVPGQGTTFFFTIPKLLMLKGTRAGS